VYGESVVESGEAMSVGVGGGGGGSDGGVGAGVDSDCLWRVGASSGCICGCVYGSGGALELRRGVRGAVDGDVHVDVCERGEFCNIAITVKSVLREDSPSSSGASGAEGRG